MDPTADDIDESALDRQMLAELEEWAAKGSADDMRERYGKEPLAGHSLEPEAAAEDPEIPGVEAEPAAEGEGPDIEKLKLVLASLKGG